MKFLLIIGYFLVNLFKGLASFFLSGGSVIFIAVATFATLCSSLYGVFQSNADIVTEWIGEMINIVKNLSSVEAGDIGGYITYACAVDSLLSWIASFLGVFFTLLTFVLFGIVSTFLGVVIPLVVFRVGFFIKSKIVNMIS